MKSDLTLVVMAAGMGSRFGGLKQIEPIGPSGEFITDYSIYDAILAGFQRVVFIIKKEHLEIFQNTIEKRIGGKIPVSYAFQENTFTYGDQVFTREKPWGTAHAILVAKPLVTGNFVVINSDDFYGRDAFFCAAKFFEEDHSPEEMGLIGYVAFNTLTEYGAVKRGVLEVENGYLKGLVESKLERVGDKVWGEPLQGGDKFLVHEDTLVSMNMLLFTPKIFDFIEMFQSDFVSSLSENFDTCEYLIPDVIDIVNRKKLATFQVLKTSAKWEGVTYPEDKEQVRNAILARVEKKEYKENLWEK